MSLGDGILGDGILGDIPLQASASSFIFKPCVVYWPEEPGVEFFPRRCLVPDGPAAIVSAWLPEPITRTVIEEEVSIQSYQRKLFPIVPVVAGWMPFQAKTHPQEITPEYIRPRTKMILAGPGAVVSAWFPRPRRVELSAEVALEVIRKKFIITPPTVSLFLPTRKVHRPAEELGIPFVFRSALSALLYHTYYAAARGLYRIFNNAEYRFYRSNSAPPEAGDTPFATNSTLPYQPGDTFADGTWYLSVSYFNGVIDSGFLPVGPRGETYLVMTVASGLDTGAKPGLPTNVRLQQRAGGVIRILAFYVGAPDGDDRANEWAIAYTTNGSTPAIDTPGVTVAMRSGALAVLSYDLPAQANGTTVKVRVQTRRATAGPVYTYSAAGTVLTAIADATGPSAPLALQSWPGQLPEDV